MAQTFARRLLGWYDREGRKDLPWKRNASAYRVWVSEIMLQQTRVGTVIPYYRRFIRRFSTVRKLADAPLDEVMAHWGGLGYYSRARNLHRAAQLVCECHRGRIPADFDELINLPGIGRSTAGAIFALARGQRRAILDGNVKRVLARHADIAGRSDDAAVVRKLWELAEQRLPHERIADYTQALMDLGALVCTRRQPRCNACPVAADCRARSLNRVALQPAPRIRKPRPERRLAMFIILHRSRVLLERRPPTGIWGGLLSFPEAAGRTQAQTWCRRHLGASATERVHPELTHDLTHLRLVIAPVEMRLSTPPRSVRENDRLVWCKLCSLDRGVAAPVKKLLKRINLNRTKT